MGWGRGGEGEDGGGAGSEGPMRQDRTHQGMSGADSRKIFASFLRV